MYPLDALGTDHAGAPSVANRIPDSAFVHVPPTWQGTGTSNWSATGNWTTNTGTGAFAPVQSDSAADAHESLVMRFPAVGTSPYVAVNDGANPTPMFVLELNSNVAGNQVIGNTLQFMSGTPLVTYNGFSGATISQLNSGAAAIGTPILAASDLTLRGTGTGIVTLSGALTNANGANLIKADASTYSITGDGSGFTQGGLTLSGGTLGVNSLVNASGGFIASGTALRGTGTLAGAVSVRGMVFPGDVSSTLTNAPKGTLTVNSADFSVNSGTLRARVWLKDATHVEADKLVIGTTATTALTLDATSTLDLRVQVPTGVVVVNNLDVEIVHGGDAANNTYSAGFGNLILSAGAGVTNMTVLYVNKSFAPNTGDTTNIVATQLPNQAPTAIGANSYNRVFVRFNNSVTPITVDAFSAAQEGAGVVLEWKLISEYQNAGFNIWRREVSDENSWTKVNSTLIPGRITHTGAKTYRVCDWPAAGSYEYRLESISIDGVSGRFAKLAPVTVDRLSVAPKRVTPLGFDAALSGAQEARAAERGAALSARLEAQQAQANSPRNAPAGSIFTGAQPLAAKIARVDRNTDPALLASLGLPAATRSAPAAPTTPADSQVVPRFLISSGTLSSQTSGYAAKVLYGGSGVMLVPQSALPPGFQAGKLRIQREGISATALALTPSGLLLYAPGYADDYTNKDAFFLSQSSAPTPAGARSAASGLFGPAVAAQSTVSAVVDSEYRDVYFDWNLRPYSYPPWFSSQYLTSGSTQSFTINAPAAVNGDGTMTVHVWSLTGGNAVSPDHRLQAFVNGQPVGEAAWDNGGMALALTFAIPAKTLVAGSNTVELVTPEIAGVASQIALLHSISLQYTQALASNGAVEIVTSSNATQVYEIAGLATRNLWVVDARYSGREALIPYETQVQADGTYKARFAAAPGGIGQYIVVPEGSEMAPLSVEKRLLRPVKSRVSYLAVGPQQFAAGIQPLLQARTKEGLRAVFVDQEEVFDYYGYGRYGPDPIRNAVRSLRPQYLLLVGRTTYDYLNYSGANVDPLCPSYLVTTGFWAQTVGDAAFGDLGRGYPEVAVGRFPVRTADELQGVVMHTLNYSGLSDSGWRGHVAADQADPDAGDFPRDADGFADTLSDIAWTRNYLGVPASNTQPVVTAALQRAASGDADLIVYVGHGNASHLGAAAPHLLDTDSVQSWSGNIVFLQSTCTANWFANNVADYQSIAIKALTQPQGGIVASIASTTYCTPPPALDFMEQLLKNASAQNGRWGGALLRAQQYAYGQSLSADAATAQWYADLAKTQCLLGDPALSVYSPANSKH